MAHIYSGVGCRAYGPRRKTPEKGWGPGRPPSLLSFFLCLKWATGNPCMGPLMEPVQGLFRSSRMSYTPAAVPSVPQPFPHSGQQTESVAAEPRYRGGGARYYLLSHSIREMEVTSTERLKQILLRKMRRKIRVSRCKFCGSISRLFQELVPEFFNIVYLMVAGEFFGRPVAPGDGYGFDSSVGGGFHIGGGVSDQEGIGRLDFGLS